MMEAADRSAVRDGGALISQVHHLSGRIFAALLRSHGIRDLNPAQWRIVYELWKENGITQTRLSERTKLDKSTLALMLKRLEKRGHITRSRDVLDARARIIRLGDENRFTRAKYQAASEKMVALFYKGLSEKEISGFESALRRILRNLEGAVSTGTRQGQRARQGLILPGS